MTEHDDLRQRRQGFNCKECGKSSSVIKMQGFSIVCPNCGIPAHNNL